MNWGNRGGGLRPANIPTRYLGGDAGESFDPEMTPSDAPKRKARLTLWGDRADMHTEWGTNTQAAPKVLVDLAFPAPTPVTVYGYGANLDAEVDEGRPVSSHWLKLEWGNENVKLVEYWDASDLVRPLVASVLRVTAVRRADSWLPSAEFAFPRSKRDRLTAFAQLGAVQGGGMASKTYWVDTSVGAPQSAIVADFVPPYCRQVHLLAPPDILDLFSSNIWPDVGLQLSPATGWGAAFRTGWTMNGYSFTDPTSPGLQFSPGMRSFEWRQTVAPWAGTTDWTCFKFLGMWP